MVSHRDVLDAPEVREPLEELREGWGDGRVVSDVVDAEGHQWVDLVMEGGGVLGVALVGYTHALESVGLRFQGIAGTSAGAINAMLLAGLDDPARPKSVHVLQRLVDQDLLEFVDGDGDAREFVDALLGDAGLMKMAWKGMQVVDNLKADMGLNPGRAFTRWLRTALAEQGVRNLGDLRRRLAALPPRTHRESGAAAARKAVRLALVTVEVRTENKVVFPEMAELFYDDAEAVDPARLVRASMSIPFFFHPFVVRDVPQGPAAVARWERHAGYRGELPRKAMFVDGGVVSNFPINQFHSRGVPAAPTFGVRLGSDRSKPKTIDGTLALAGAVFDSARHCLDYDFFLRHPDYRHLVAVVETGDHNWLDFELPDAARLDLFARGVRAARDFLLHFDWAGYKRVRAELGAV